MTSVEPEAAFATDPVPSAGARPGPSRTRRPGRRVPGWAGVAVAALAFAAMAPTLPWLEFSNGIEQLHAATVLEMRRPGGNWLMPTLNGALRIKKPPLPAWVGALAVTDPTMAGVGSLDPAARSAGFARLAWEVRWPALLAGCLMLVATFDLGRTVGGQGGGRSGGNRVGLAAVVVAATSLLFLRYVRLASTDVHLALWVATANALLARALLRRQAWCLAGVGAAVGLAVMCKGPVALLQTLVPVGAWACVVAWNGRHRGGARGFTPSVPPRGQSGRADGRTSGASVPRSGDGTAPPPHPGGVGVRHESRVPTRSSHVPTRSSRAPARSLLAPTLVAVVAFLAVALPWPVLVWLSRADALDVWRAEVFREGATDHEYGPVWSYLSLLPNLLPWLPAFAVGVGLTLRRWGPILRRPKAERGPLRATAGELLRAAAARRGYLLVLLWLVVPVVVMSVVRDKSERYLLPMLPAAAVLAGRGVVAILAGVRRGRRPAHVWLAVHLYVVGVMAVALPQAGMVPAVLARTDGSAWYPPAVGGPALVLAVAMLGAMLLLARFGRPAAALGVAAAVMFGVNALLLWGYKDSAAGRSEMRPVAERILAARPAATVAYFEPGRKPMPPDLSIYLNRVVRPLEGMRRRGEPDPDVIVTLQREDQSFPPPGLDGWRSFAAEPYGRRFWHAMEKAAMAKPQ